MFCCTLLYVSSSFAIILIGKRVLVALLSLTSWCLAIVVLLFLAVPWVCLQFVIVVFPDHTHLLLLITQMKCRMRHFIRAYTDFLLGKIDFFWKVKCVTPYYIQLAHSSFIAYSCLMENSIGPYKVKVKS